MQPLKVNLASILPQHHCRISAIDDAARLELDHHEFPNKLHGLIDVGEDHQTDVDRHAWLPTERNRKPTDHGESLGKELAS